MAAVEVAAKVAMAQAGVARVEAQEGEWTEVALVGVEEAKAAGVKGVASMVAFWAVVVVRGAGEMASVVWVARVVASWCRETAVEAMAAETMATEAAEEEVAEGEVATAVARQGVATERGWLAVMEGAYLVEAGQAEGNVVASEVVDQAQETAAVGMVGVRCPHCSSLSSCNR